MKNLIIAAIMAFAISFYSCSGKKKADEGETQTDEQIHDHSHDGHDHASHDHHEAQQEEMEAETEEGSASVSEVSYQCPMKCEGDKTYADASTKCPKCGMDLAKI